MAVNLSQYQGQYSDDVLRAAQNIFNSKPDQEEVFVSRYGGDLGAWLASFEDWWTNNFSQVQGQMGTTYGPESALLSALGYEFANEAGDQTMPIEQALFQTALNDYILPDIARDQDRRQEVDDIIASYGPAMDGARDTVNDIFDGSLLAAEQAESTALAQAQLNSLNEQVAALGSNLDAELAARAASLQQQLAELSAGLDTLTDAQRQALAAQLSSNFDALQVEMDTRRANLADAIDSMGQTIDAEQAARKQSLQNELDALNAAQEPVNNMRLQGAEALATAVNLGLQTTRDQIVADAARRGYVGGSTGTDAALVRATVDARQNAAQAIADAKLRNAEDTAGIARYGAGETRSIDDASTQQRSDLGFYGATEGRTLGDYGATQRRSISDFGAAEERGIAGADAQARFDLTSFGADARRSNADYGSSQRRAIGDAGATERRGIQDAEANRRLSFFSDDIARRLSALSLPASALNTELNMRTSADEYGYSGLNRAFNTLNWFAPASSGSAPTGSPYYQNPEDSGYENLGAGLLSIAGNIGNANNWWQTNQSGMGKTTTFDQFVADNPGSSAAGWSQSDFDIPQVQTDWS